MASAITVHNLSKTFYVPTQRRETLREHLMNFHVRNDRQAIRMLDNISFEIQQGEFFGIIGRNGCGKSTLLKIIAGIYAPDHGSKVAVNGAIAPLLELGVGFNPELTGRENLFLNATILGLSRSKIEKCYSEIVAFAQLENFMELPIKHYSSGMAMRLAFAISIQVDAPIMLLDEVFAVGDCAFSEKCFAYFEQCKREGKTVILVTHSEHLMKRFADRAMLLHHTRIEAIGDLDNVLKTYHQFG